MKKPLTPLFTGFLIGLAAGVILDAILSPGETPKAITASSAVEPETIESLDRKRIVAVSEERYNDAAKLRDAINKIKYNGNTN